MLLNKRMSTTYPIMLTTALNQGIFSVIFIQMMVSTMGDSHGWSKQDKDSKALLCMLGLGAGEILGALAFGRIADKLENKKTIMINMLM